MAKTTTRKAQDDRLAACVAAVSDEQARFNKAIAAGAVVSLDTFNGPCQVRRVSADFWYHTDGNGGYGRSWAGCNDWTWANLLAQAGVERNRLWR